jgi:hypothetical protein
MTIEAMARVHLAAVKKVQPTGPYRIGGYCHGGLVAYEMARQLTQLGEQVDTVVLVDSYAMNINLMPIEPLVRGFIGAPTTEARVNELAATHYRLHYYPRRLRQISRLGLGGVLGWMVQVAKRYAGIGKSARLADDGSITSSGGAGPSRAEEEPGLGPVGAFVQRAQRAYMPGRYRGRVDLIWASGESRARWANDFCGWDRVTEQAHVHIVEGTHTSIVLPQGLPGLAAAIRACLGSTTRR